MSTAQELAQQLTAVAGRFENAIDRDEAQRIERMALELSAHASPLWAEKYARKAAPAIGVIGATLEVIVPLVNRCGLAAYAIYGRLPSEYAKGLGGIGLCFFGGRYTVSIAAAQAFRSTGGSKAYMHLQELQAQVLALQTAGIADTSAYDKSQPGGATNLITSKVMLALKTVDPEVVTTAASGLWTAYMGVLSVLKFKFAQTLALTQGIGESLRPSVAKLVGPTLVAVTPPEFRKWISPGINVSCKMLAGLAAWRLQYLLSTLQSSLQGGMITSTVLLHMLAQRGIVKFTSAEESLFTDAAGWSLAVCGLYVQMFWGLPVPYFMSPLMWPLDFLEWVLNWTVTLTPGI